MGTVHLEIDRNIAILTVDSPEVKNGLTPEMGEELVAHCETIDADPDVGAAIVRGANGTFCSGADRRRWDPTADQTEERLYREAGSVYAAFRRVGSLAVPSIAAVQGAAVGAGMNLMLATDLRVVAHDARLIAGFLRIGLHPGGGYFTISGRAAGREATAAMGLFSEEIDGVRAREVGLAWATVEAGEVDKVAVELAERAAQDPALAREAVRSMRTELGPPAIGWDAALHFERATQMWSQRRRQNA